MLHHAASRGDTATVRQLVASKANIQGVDRSQRTALHLAALQGHPATIQTLLEAPGVEINAVDVDQRSPLHLAALGSHGQAFQRLMASGADLKPDKDGSVALDLVPDLMDPKWIESCSRAAEFASTSPRNRGDSTPDVARPPAAVEAEDSSLWGRLRGRFRSNSASPRTPQ